MSQCATSGPSVNSEPIPGYVLRERIGSGGFGEVWKAEAPGGLWKAIKFVYGTLDEARAAQEMRSLSRIRAVQHPFLLSIERIEIVDGHLMIVSELAGSCLKERFEECRREGSQGIPREELLGYLRDAADVLDFLYDKHSLQHLDVKPENLLLVGNHIKVADFGLLKNLQDACMSVMAGLTPFYSPPEVLGGRPSRFSDQYSLAIVFQEMLTGEPPFAGRTTAQLAAQHLHSAPNLKSLQADDQPVVARALAKKPESRFPNCRSFVEALMVPTKLARHTMTRAPSPRTPVHGVEKTEMLDHGAPFAELGHGEPLLAMVEDPARDLRPLTDQSEEYGPTVLIGVGGVGARILRNVRRKLIERLSNADLPEAVQMLAVDLDRQSLSGRHVGPAGENLSARDSVLLPLRPAASYRPDAERFLGWLQRKWLFNVPRSLQTEGIRPLGRLALVDNSEQLYAALRRTLQHACDDTARTASEERTGLPFRRKSPHVFLVAAIGGGTGSGMIIDLAFAVRAQLRSLGFEDGCVRGVLVHATGKNQQARDLAVASSCSCLSELRDYGTAGRSYPGDPSCDLPAFPDHSSVFRDTYVVHLGDELSDEEFTCGLDRVADYLHINVLTPAGAHFENARSLEHCGGDGVMSDVRVRSIDLVRTPITLRPSDQQLESMLFGALGRHWSEVPVSPQDSGHPFPELETRAALFVEEQGLRLENLLASAKEQLLELTKLAPDRLAAQVVDKLCAQPPAPPTRAAMFLGIDMLLGATEIQGAQTEPLSTQLAHRMRYAANIKGRKAAEWIMELIEVPGVRVAGARWAAKWFGTLLEGVHARARSWVERAEDEFDAIRSRAATNSTPNRLGAGYDFEPWREELIEYASLRLQQIFHRCAVGSVVAMMTQLNSAVSRIRGALDGLRLLGQRMQTQVVEAVDGVSAGLASNTVADDRYLEPAMIMDVDRAFSAQLSAEQVSFAELLNRSTGFDEIAVRIRSAIQAVRAKADAGDASLPTGALGAEQLPSLQRLLEKALPRLATCGGARRLMVIAPPDLSTTELRAQLSKLTNDQLTIVQDRIGELVVCYEVEQIPIDNVLAKLIGTREDILEVARRLHTRIDVSWSL